MKRYTCVLLAASLLPAEETKKAPVLNAGAQEAVKLSETWTASPGNRPASGTDGRVVYAFGAGLATVVCAPLHICVIELQAGETMTSEPRLGDTVRWHIAPANYGTGANKTEMIVLQPIDPDVETDLVIPTDRRTYYLRLQSHPKDYVARTTFTYPDSDTAAWKKHAAEVERDRIAANDQERPVMLPAIRAAEELDFNYVVTVPKNVATPIKPTKVFSDATHT
jgi:P-type conjugative transfer protein TrbG